MPPLENAVDGLRQKQEEKRKMVPESPPTAFSTDLGRRAHWLSLAKPGRQGVFYIWGLRACGTPGIWKRDLAVRHGNRGLSSRVNQVSPPCPTGDCAHPGANSRQPPEACTCECMHYFGRPPIWRAEIPLVPTRFPGGKLRALSLGPSV